MVEPVDKEDVLKIILQIAEGLEYLVIRLQDGELIEEYISV